MEENYFKEGGYIDPRFADKYAREAQSEESKVRKDGRDIKELSAAQKHYLHLKFLRAAEAYEGASIKEKTLDNYNNALSFLKTANSYFPNPRTFEKKIKGLQAKVDELTAEAEAKEKKKQSPFNMRMASQTWRTTQAIIAVFSFLAALFFLSLDFTGAAIGSLPSGGSHWIGIGLFALGLIFVLLYFRNRPSK